jgi:hypothetical protein
LRENSVACGVPWYSFEFRAGGRLDRQVARCLKGPVEKGGWSVFHTWFTGGTILNPVVTA